MPGVNEYDSILQELDQQNSGRVSRSVYSAADTNPEQESGLHKISRRSGIPVEALRLDGGAEAKRRIAVQEVETLPTHAPRTAEFLSNPENARLSWDDVQELANIEGIFSKPVSTMGIATPGDRETAKRAKSIGRAFVEGLSTAPERVNQGLARTGQEVAEFVDWSLAAFPDETGMRKRVAEIAKESADYWKKAAEAKLGKTAPRSAESYFQQAGSSIGTSLLAAPFGIGGEGAALAMFGLFSDGGYDEMRQAGVSVPAAVALSVSNQAMEGLTEKIGLDRLYKGNGPVLKKAIQFVMGDLGGEEINTLYNAMVDKVTIRPDMTMGDVVQQVVDTAIVTSIAGPAQGVSMSGAAKASGSLYDNYLRQRQAQQQADFLTALGDGVKASKTFARLPEKVQELVREAKQDGPVTDVFIPVERFTELFQSQGMDPVQAAEQILSDPKRFYEAVATGGDVAIPLEEFATLANEPFYQELVKDARTSLDGMTAREAETFGADSETFINDLLRMAQDDETPEGEAYQGAYQRIYDDTYGQLIGIGRDPGQAEADATIRAKGLATLAERYGYDPAELERLFPVSISRGELPAALQRQPSFAEQQQEAQLFAMLDAIRSGKGVDTSEMFGPSLGEFLRANGIPIDKAREAAVEAGYLPEDSTVADLLDAVANELKGQPVYSPANQRDDLVEQQAAHDELAQWLDMMGVDLQATDNAGVKELLQKSVSEFAQGANPVAVLTGEELGEYEDIKQLRKAAVQWYRNNLQGTTAQREDLGKIRFTQVGRKEVESYSANPDKLRLVPGLLQVVEQGEYIREESPVHPRRDGIVKFHIIEGNVALQGESFRVRVEVAEDKAGNKFYDMFPDAIEHEKKKASKQRSGSQNPGEPGGSPEGVATFDQSISDTSTGVNIVIVEQDHTDKRGYIRFGEGISGFDVALLKNANASTFIHEMGHYYLEVLGRLSEMENAPEQLQNDYQTILQWLGAESRENITVEMNERFARGFEAYLYEGRAPSQDLRGVFQRFKTWLKAVYASLKNLNVELTDEVRGVFDRLLATDEEIAAAEGEQNVRPIYATAEEAGMSEKVFEAYRKLAEQAHEEAKDRLDRRKLQEERRAHEAWWKDAREKMMAEVEAEARENPVYEALNFLYTGKLFDGSVYEGEDYKLSKAALLKMYDEPTVRAMQKKLGWVYRKEGGLSPDLVAEMFGFSSGDELIRRMMEAPKLREWVKAETDRRMVERYGEMNTAEIAEAALNAVHNDDQAKLLREELRAINRKRREVRPFVRAAEGEGKDALSRERAEREYERRWLEAERKLAVAIEKGAVEEEIRQLKESIRADKERARAARKLANESIPPVEFFREAARRAIAGKKVADILPGVYSRAEAKAGKEAFELNGKGKFDEAARAKERQLLNHYLYREAVQARGDADKIAAYMRRLETPKAQQRLGKAGQDYLDQVNALLDRYEFRRVTNREAGERERLLDWLERKERENGFMPPVPPSVLNDALEVNYRSLSIGELRDVYEAAEAIVHLARTEGKLFREEQKREIAELADEAAASIEDHSKGLKPRKPEKNLPQDRPGKLMENYFASHRKMSSLARQMDGSHDGGMMWQLIIRPLNEAGDKEAVMRAEAAEKLNGIFSVYSALERTKMHRREFIPEINASMSRWGRITVALNMGNEGNRQRLSSMFTPEQVRAITDTLDERDWQFVQNVWDLIDGYWPEIEAKEKRVHGVAPEKVAATPVVTKYGTLPGGYYPIKYDREETAKTGAQEEEEIYKQMMGGAFTRATTRRGHTEARLEAVNRPLSLSIDTLFQHMNQVIHDLTHHEMLMDVNRLLGTTQIQEAIRDHYGMEAYHVFTDGIRDVAVGDLPAQDAFEKFMAYTRVGVSTAGLGYNIITSMMQPMGLTQSMVRIGPKWVGKGISRWIGSPRAMVETAEWIYGKSDFMRMRAKTQNREIAEIRNQMTVGVVPHAVRDSFFYLIQQMQKTVDIPTWLGQYEKSMAEGADEAEAIAQADQAVIDSQAGGQVKDLARIQRGGPMKKLFSTFYSFFSTTYNLAAESRSRTHFNNPAEVGRFVVDMLLLYTLPVVLTVLLKEAVNRAIGGGDDDDKLLKKLAGEQLGYVMGGFIGLRELSSAFSGFQGYEGPAGARFYSETGKLMKEIGQGEADAGLFKRLNSVGGILLHYPSTQVQRIVDGMIEMKEGRGNLLSLLFGKPKK